MIALTALAAASRLARHAVAPLAREPETAWEAKGLGELVPPATLAEARAHRDDLARLLRREREASADFLLALADFDRRRGWERLGHASLFAFLTRELGLSNGAAWCRQSAARLLPHFPAVEQALRAGQLCLSVVGDLARVLTPENEAEVLPRFLGISSREAKEVVAAILPCPSPPRRDVVRVVGNRARATAGAALPAGFGAVAAVPADQGSESMLLEGALTESAPGSAQAPRTVATPLLAPEVTPTHPTRGVRDAVVPLTAELRRLSMTVSARFLRKLDAARDGLSHAIPGATAEQVLEAALDRLLEHQARRRGQMKRQRRSGPRVPPPLPPPPPAQAPAAETPVRATPASAPDPRYIPAEVRREVWARDEGRCQHPLDVGGICGSTVRVEIDHLRPVVFGGRTPVAAELRLACRIHNLEAAREVLGGAVMSSARRKGRRR
jgi:hypothetical protein